MRNIFLIAFCFISFSFLGQELEQEWQFNTVTKSDGASVLEVSSELLIFSLVDGKFELPAFAENEKASGTYLRQNNLMIFNFKEPESTLRYFNIISFDNARLVLSEGDLTYSFSSQKYEMGAVTATAVEKGEQGVEPNDTTSDGEASIVPSGDFTFTSLWRGVLGMFSLIFIAFQHIF
jgi:CNT family concentrative nucleoside transporter